MLRHLPHRHRFPEAPGRWPMRGASQTGLTLHGHLSQALLKLPFDQEEQQSIRPALRKMQAANVNQHIISETLDFYISLLYQSSVPNGPPSPFAAEFPLVDGALLVTRHRHMELTINFRQETVQMERGRGVSMKWWINYAGARVSGFMIPAETFSLLRHWTPSGAFVLQALRTSLWQTAQNTDLSLMPGTFTASTFGRTPAQELCLVSSTGEVITGPVLYRCITRRCGRVFAPGGTCPQHPTQ
ncbi:hypothetical protein HMN09_00925700 [Mycena chlorophos]|uniref:Uncharacterized protein n=1 Tax=Mycena chlorophos TaxID=658473 RepID=A0A8H6SKD8_MYCCL|nr:hypothetical protein HMN09_00925700 [Mycena chlorophos]